MGLLDSWDDTFREVRHVFDVQGMHAYVSIAMLSSSVRSTASGYGGIGNPARC